MIVFITFLFLAAVSVLLRRTRSRSREDWILDASGLLLQGVAMPLLQMTLLYAVLSWLFPHLRGSIPLGFVPGFLLNFIGVDYLYYWNHRLLHGRWLWQVHAVHHGADRFDVFVTSRNTLWASFLILYFWINGLGMFLLREPAGFLFGASLGAALDLWRHTTFSPHGWLSGLLILPRDHAWHHSRDRSDCNFGANFSLWDRLHGTYCGTAGIPTVIGIPSKLSLSRKLFYPWQ
jgi:sterol desaturase/sphingolipid hydroxylase (fatty acid hydroxylase superfamily)